MQILMITWNLIITWSLFTKAHFNIYCTMYYVVYMYGNEYKHTRMNTVPEWLIWQYLMKGNSRLGLQQYINFHKKLQQPLKKFYKAKKAPSTTQSLIHLSAH